MLESVYICCCVCDTIFININVVIVIFFARCLILYLLNLPLFILKDLLVWVLFLTEKMGFLTMAYA